MIDRYVLRSRVHVSLRYLYPSSHSGVVVLQGLAEGPEDRHGIHVPLRLDRGQGLEVEEVVRAFPDLEIDLRDDDATAGVIFLEMSVVTTTTVCFFSGGVGCSMHRHIDEQTALAIQQQYNFCIFSVSAAHILRSEPAF